MERGYQKPEGRHLADLALEAVWVADEQGQLDEDHAQALSRLGIGSGVWRFSRPN